MATSKVQVEPETDLVEINELAALIQPGELVAIPADYSGVSMAATRALIARRAGPLRVLAVPTSGLQADLLIGAGLVSELESSAITLGEYGGAPRFSAAALSGALQMRDTTCAAVHAGLQAAEKGVPFQPLRGLLGSDLLAHREDWKTIDSPFPPAEPIVLVAALRPDVALFHVTRADRQGNVWIGRRRELAAMAHAAARTLVTCEELVEGSLLEDEELAAGALPSLYVTAIAEAPLGAWPLGLLDRYAADEEELAAYAEAARSEAGFASYLERFLTGVPKHS